MTLRIKRAYEPPAPEDGLRVLVDRLWPRGLQKSAARIDRWMKEAAPSDGLRRWFAHRPERFAEFRRRYAAELAGNPALGELRALGRGRPVTLLYGARDPKLNQAVVLLDLLRRQRPYKAAATGGAASAKSRPKRAR
jgi:uncharacterized protein YeaO (DUF488 family)